MEEIQNLLQAIQDKRILPSQDDLILMREAGDGRFSMKLLYKALVGSNTIAFRIVLFRVTGFPPRWGFFDWKAS